MLCCWSFDLLRHACENWIPDQDCLQKLFMMSHIMLVGPPLKIRFSAHRNFPLSANTCENSVVVSNCTLYVILHSEAPKNPTVVTSGKPIFWVEEDFNIFERKSCCSAAHAQLTAMWEEQETNIFRLGRRSSPLHVYSFNLIILLMLAVRDTFYR